MPILIFIYNSSVISRNKSGDERKLLTIFNQFYINVKEEYSLLLYVLIFKILPDESQLCFTEMHTSSASASFHYIRLFRIKIFPT